MERERNKRMSSQLHVSECVSMGKGVCRANQANGGQLLWAGWPTLFQVEEVVSEGEQFTKYTIVNLTPLSTVL